MGCIRRHRRLAKYGKKSPNHSRARDGAHQENEMKVYAEIEKQNNIVLVKRISGTMHGNREYLTVYISDGTETKVKRLKEIVQQISTLLDCSEFSIYLRADIVF